jgi:DNA-binding response OmpR family regulator
MTPAMHVETPPHIQSVLNRLHELGDELARDAAALITAFVSQAQPTHIAVCLTNNTVQRGGVTLSLSPNQAVALHMLSEHYPSVVTIGRLHIALWGSNSDRSTNTLRVMMTELRKKLVPLKVLIQNQHGFGYRLELQPIT